MTCNLQKINHSNALAKRLVLNFSCSFNSVLWNTVALPDKRILFVENRDETRRKVTFSALRYDSGTFLWKDRELVEPWWAGLLAASADTLLMQRYNPDNPDKKALIAVDVETFKIQWTAEDFSFDRLLPGAVSGFFGMDDPELITLDLKSGQETASADLKESPDDEISGPVRPFHYQEGTSYRATVSDYLFRIFGHRPEGHIEYLEIGGKVVISYHIRDENNLTNYLLVIEESGKVMLNEKLGEGLTGLGTDTFFVLSGCLFFVRKKKELLSYQLL